MIDEPVYIIEGEVDVFQVNGKNSLNSPGFTCFQDISGLLRASYSS